MRIAAAATALSLVAVFAYAETRSTLTSLRQPPSDSGLTLHVTTREIVVDVTVTDAHGNPIHGLKREDFALKEDGKPQPIRGFEEFGKHVVAAPPKLPPNVYTNVQPPAAGPVNILLLDFANAGPVLALSCCGASPAGAISLANGTSREHRVQHDALQYLQQMPPGTRVVVLGMFSPGKLRILQGVTSDPALLRAAIDTAPYDTQGIADSYESWCSQQNMRNRMTLESLDQIAADAAGIKGRKNLLWFTVGIQTIDGTVSVDCLPDSTPALKKAYGLLAASHVTAFPISVYGVGTGLIPDTLPGVPPWNNPPASWLSMEAIAEATGGKAYYNNNDLAQGIAQAIDRGSDYYTITYPTPAAEYDGRHHSINVKVDRPDIHLTYRQSYYAEDPTKIVPTPGLALAANVPEAVPDGKASAQPSDPQATMRVAMTHGISASTGLLFDAQVEPSTEPAKPTDPAIFGVLDVKYKTKHLTRYGVEFVFPARQLAFTPGPNNTHRGGIEFDVVAFDPDGHLINSLSQTLQLPLSESTYQQMQKGPFRFFQQLDLPPGETFLRVGIRDLTSNKIGTLEIPITVPKTPPDHAAK